MTDRISRAFASDPLDDGPSPGEELAALGARAATLSARPRSRCPVPTVGGRIAGITAAAAIVGSLVLVGPGRDRSLPPDLVVPSPAPSEQVSVADRSVESLRPAAHPPSSVDDWSGVTEASDLGSHSGTRSQLDVLLDSMLITQRVPPGVPFEERIGQVDDPRILEVMRDIDDSLGGRIEWPNVHVTDGLRDDGKLGIYRSDLDGGGATVSPEVNARYEPLKRYGIHLSKDLVEHERSTGMPDVRSVRHLLAHELQHAVSYDNASALTEAAGSPGATAYSDSGVVTAEGRADLAQLVLAEMDQRRHVDGPRLNELPLEERREVLREVLTQYLTPFEDPPRRQADLRLEVALTDDSYLHRPENLVWNEVRDERTRLYVVGVETYDSPDRPFVPTGMDPERRRQDLDTPLDELAERWTAERADRPATYAERVERYPSRDDARGYLGSDPLVVTGTSAASARSSDRPLDPVAPRSSDPAPRSAPAETPSLSSALLLRSAGRPLPDLRSSAPASGPSLDASPSTGVGDGESSAAAERRRRLIAPGGGASLPAPALAPPPAGGVSAQAADREVPGDRSPR